VADSQIVHYKQLRGGQMEVWLARYLDDYFEMKRTGTTETSVERTPHEHYEYELWNATRVPENSGNPPVF